MTVRKGTLKNTIKGIVRKVLNESINSNYYNQNKIKKHKKALYEAMMDGFSFDKLRGQSFVNKIKYCKQMFGGQIGGGSSRIVFQIDDNWVLKLARNNKGIAQNQEEYRIASDLYATPLSTKVDEKRSDTENYEWIVSEYVLPAKQQDFKQCYGVDWNDVVSFIEDLVRGGQKEGEFFEKYEENEDATNLFNDLHEYYANWDSGIGDACRICNWGMTNRDGYPEMVLLDTGLSMDVYRKHYK